MTVRVIALVEGQTEETFVRRLLAPMLGEHGVEISATTYGRLLDARPRRIIRELQQVAGHFATPEEIDEGQGTAPSKRIRSFAAHYQKVTDGNLAATRIGLKRMRRKCPHFDHWLDSLEALGQRRRAG